MRIHEKIQEDECSLRFSIKYTYLFTWLFLACCLVVFPITNQVNKGKCILLKISASVYRS